MRPIEALVGLWFTLCVAACAGASQPARGIEARATASGAAARSFEPTAPPVQAEAAGPAVAAAAAAPPERAGLGTAWGETRESHAEDVTFLRESPSAPFAVAELRYDDRAGVDALVAYHGGERAYPVDVSVADGAITVYLVDHETDTPLEAVRVGDRTYVVGEEGHRYGIVVANRTDHRVEAVATVDGLDVVSGRRGRYDRRGYVLAPWATLEIDGYRRSQDAVASFRFAGVGRSYAAERGDARNVGVIGVAFFAERGDPWATSDLRLRDTARPFSSDGRFAPPP